MGYACFLQAAEREPPKWLQKGGPMCVTHEPIYASSKEPARQAAAPAAAPASPAAPSLAPPAEHGLQIVYHLGPIVLELLAVGLANLQGIAQRSTACGWAPLGCLSSCTSGALCGASAAHAAVPFPPSSKQAAVCSTGRAQRRRPLTGQRSKQCEMPGVWTATTVSLRSSSTLPADQGS